MTDSTDSSEPTEPANPAGSADPTRPIGSAGAHESYESAGAPGSGATVAAGGVDSTGPDSPDGGRFTAVEPYYAEFPEQDTPPEEPSELELRPRPERLKRAAIVGARVVSGTVGIVVAAVVVAGAALVPLPSYTADAPSLEVVPVATAQQLVCPGSLLRLSDASGADATATSATGVAGVTSASTSGSVSATAFAITDAGTGGTASAPQLLTTAVADGSDAAPLVSGVQAQVEVSDDLFGLAAASCTVASSEDWLVGGATTTGRSTLITLSNPSTVAATVDLEIFGEQGTVSSPGLTGIVVAPGAQRVLSLAGFAPSLASPVVHVTSTGGLIAASLQQSVIRGIEPGGVDTIAGTADPSTTNVIPGVVISGAEAVASRLGATGFDDLVTALRVFIPGTGTVEARVDIQPEDGTTTGTSFAIDVQAGVVTDLPIDELGDGSYTITVDTDEPAVVSARVAVVGSDAVSGQSDFAWITSAENLEAESMVSVPFGVDAVLHLANPTATDLTVALTPVAPTSAGATEGTASELTIVAGSTAAVAVTAGASYQISGFDSLFAGVTTTLDGGVAAYTVVPRAAESTPIVVYP